MEIRTVQSTSCIPFTVNSLRSVPDRINHVAQRYLPDRVKSLCRRYPVCTLGAALAAGTLFSYGAVALLGHTFTTTAGTGVGGYFLFSRVFGRQRLDHDELARQRAAEELQEVYQLEQMIAMLDAFILADQDLKPLCELEFARMKELTDPDREPGEQGVEQHFNLAPPLVTAELERLEPLKREVVVGHRRNALAFALRFRKDLLRGDTQIWNLFCQRVRERNVPSASPIELQLLETMVEEGGKN